MDKTDHAPALFSLNARHIFFFLFFVLFFFSSYLFNLQGVKTETSIPNRLVDFIANVNLSSERSNPGGNSARNSFLPAAARSEGVARSQRSKYNEELPGRFFLRKSEPFKMSLFFSMMKNKCAVARL